MEKKFRLDGRNCETWEECKKWARERLSDRFSLEWKEEPDDHYQAYLVDPRNLARAILWYDGSEAWSRLAKDGWAYVRTIPEIGGYKFDKTEWWLNESGQYWIRWTVDHESEYFAEAYKGAEFERIVHDVAKALADDLGIEIDEE